MKRTIAIILFLLSNCSSPNRTDDGWDRLYVDGQNSSRAEVTIVHRNPDDPADFVSVEVGLGFSPTIRVDGDLYAPNRAYDSDSFEDTMEKLLTHLRQGTNSDLSLEMFYRDYDASNEGLSNLSIQGNTIQFQFFPFDNYNVYNIIRFNFDYNESGDIIGLVPSYFGFYANGITDRLELYIGDDPNFEPIGLYRTQITLAQLDDPNFSLIPNDPQNPVNQAFEVSRSRITEIQQCTRDFIPDIIENEGIGFPEGLGDIIGECQ